MPNHRIALLLPTLLLAACTDDPASEAGTETAGGSETSSGSDASSGSSTTDTPTGGAEGGVLVVGEGVKYCASSPSIPTESWHEARDLKAWLSLPAGSYPLPEFTETFVDHPFTLAFEVSGLAFATESATGVKEGRLVYTGTDYLVDGYFGLEIYQDSDAGDWSLVFEMAAAGDDPERIFAIEPEYVPYHQFQAIWRGVESIRMVACTLGEVSFDERVTVAFEGGEVAFVRRGGDWIAGGLKPSIVMSAEGQLDGQAFAQTRYEQLYYLPGDMLDYRQSYAVLFDAPLDGACGLFVRNTRDPEGIFAPQAGLLDCELNEIADRTVLDVTHELL